MSESAATVSKPRRRRTSVVKQNPHASVAIGSGTGIVPLVVWLIGLSGTQVPPEVSAIVAGTVAWVVVLVGHRGIKGSIGALWNGNETR